MPSLAGSKLDKYEIVEEVGHGGMAVVYRGNDTVLEREVAVKVLHSHLADREESRARLQREALAVAKLRHDNILEIFDYSGGDVDESYIVTEFIHGPTMRQWVDEQLDPRPTIAAMIVHRLCLALREAHRSGIVHRDIKPENVMVRKRDGVLKLMDFGIAQIIDDQKLTLTGQLIGSPAYMAPELISGRPLDQRTDLFSLGILLYQLATGTLPFSGRNPHEVLNRIADGDYPPPASVCPLVDRDLEAIIAVSLATSPEERFQTAETFAKELERYLEEMGVTPSPEELKAYFTDPKGYVRALDERVACTLMERAKAASEQGHTARAVALLGRVLEIDNGHAGARALLEKVRRRERRLRQVLVGAGALALIGLVSAGVMLVPKGSMSSRVASAAGEQASSVDAPKPPIPSKRSEPRNSGPLSTEPVPATIPSTSPRPGPEATTTDASAKPKPADVQPVGSRPGRRPKRVSPEAETPSTFKCVVELEYIPFNTARNHKLAVGKQLRKIDAKRTELTLEKPTTVSLTGGSWRGSARLTPEACASGSVKLPANPKDAIVTVAGAPPGASVVCLEGCKPDDIKQPQLADKPLQPIPIDRETGERKIRLQLKAPGYETKIVTRKVWPSSNPPVRANMVER
ncbi:MAG: serine/threonine protein kinase [Nannocystaceae bacterium]|nr:protein kinase [bacterium]